jgi:hypothetical protein
MRQFKDTNYGPMWPYRMPSYFIVKDHKLLPLIWWEKNILMLRQWVLHIWRLFKHLILVVNWEYDLCLEGVFSICLYTKFYKLAPKGVEFFLLLNIFF